MKERKISFYGQKDNQVRLSHSQIFLDQVILVNYVFDSHTLQYLNLIQIGNEINDMKFQFIQK